MKKLLTLGIIALTAIFMSCASSGGGADKPAKEEKEPWSFSPTEDGELDLSTASSVDFMGLTFNDETGVLTCKNIESFGIPLGQEIPFGTVVKCHVVGKNNGKEGFRSWLVDDNQKTGATIYTDTVGDGLPKGDFDITFELTATEHDAGAQPPNNFFIKGARWGTLIDNIEIYKVSCTW